MKRIRRIAMFRAFVLFIGVAVLLCGCAAHQPVYDSTTSEIIKQAHLDAEANASQLWHLGLIIPVTCMGVTTYTVYSDSFGATDDLMSSVCVGAAIGSVTPNILPYILMLVPEPTPNPEALIGKSPEYVAVYTMAYQKRCDQLRKHPAMWGGTVTLTAFAISAIWLYHYSLNSGDLPELSN